MSAEDAGYRREPAGGPSLRTDVVDVYVYRGAGGAVEFLQVRRAADPLAGTWHPVMGHVERGESAARCAARELREELGLAPGDPALLRLWALEQVHPYYIPEIDAVVLSPRFAAEVRPDWEPRLSAESSAFRWVPAEGAAESFMWPGQGAACAEVLSRLRREPGASQ